MSQTQQHMTADAQGPATLSIAPSVGLQVSAHILPRHKLRVSAPGHVAVSYGVYLWLRDIAQADLVYFTDWQEGVWMNGWMDGWIKLGQNVKGIHKAWTDIQIHSSLCSESRTDKQADRWCED
eukprot:scaffold177390_cov35-Prasinocladus_malaysianus.AAC.1